MKSLLTAVALFLSGTALAAFPGPQINGNQIQNGTIDTSKLASDSITTVKILNSNVDTTKLATDSVVAAKILNGTITAAKYAAGSVDTTATGTDSVTAAKILNGTITAAKFAAGAVDTTALGTDAVTNVKILNGVVDTAKLATDSVSNAKLLNGSVDTAKLASDAVTNAKIVNGTIDTIKLKITNNGPGGAAIFDANGKYPAKDGSQITNIPGTLSGLTANVVPVASGSSAIDNGQSYITSIASGVRVSTGLAVGIQTRDNSVGEGLSVYNLIVSSTPIPTFSADSGTLTVDPDSTNSNGMVTCGSGTSVITITFNTSSPWRRQPRCRCFSQSGSTGHIWYASISATTSFQCQDGGVNCSGEKVGYDCSGVP